MTGPRQDLVVVGDVHIGRNDPALEDFLRFLATIAPSTGRLVFLGDLFELWIGRPELEEPQHRAVAAALAEMRRGGTVVRYLEGNRDYRVGDVYLESALDEVSGEGFVERFAGGTLFAAHGDRVDPSDRAYRSWRAVSRSLPAWLLFNSLPAGARLWLADRLRRRFGHEGRRYASAVPEEEIRRFAAGELRKGHSAVVLGHFHVERDLEARPPSPPGRILVLPEWKGSRRHLRVPASGRPEIVNSPA